MHLAAIAVSVSVAAVTNYVKDRDGLCALSTNSCINNTTLLSKYIAELPAATLLFQRQGLCLAAPKT